MNKVALITIRHWKYLLCFNVIVLAGTVASVEFSPRVWTAKAQFILPDSSSNLDTNLGTLGSLRKEDHSFSSIQVNPLKVQASIMVSDAVLQQVWASDPEKSKYSLGKYSKLFKVSPQEQTTNISLSVNGSSPEIARKRTTALTEAYQQRLNELRRVNGAAREQFSRSKLEQAHERLSNAQIALAEFKKSSGLVNNEEQSKGIVVSINNLTTEQAQTVAQAQSNEARIKTLSTRIGLTPDQAIRSLRLSENKDYQSIRQKLSEIEAALVPTRSRYTDEFPQVQFLLSQRDQLRRQLGRYIAQAAGSTQGIDPTLNTSPDGGRKALIQQLILAESEGSAQGRQATQLQRQVDKLNTALKSIPVNQGRLLELQQQYDVADGVYKGLVAQVQQANIDAFNTYPNVQLLDSATVDLNPSSPNKSLAAINAILASVIGSIALILLLESRNPLLSPKDLQAIKFPIVVIISRLKQSAEALALGSETEVEFQRLASAISSQSLKDRRLLVTSSNVGEGKTTVTIGLAKALVDLGSRVLVVDGDFRQAGMSRSLGYAQDLTDSTKQPIMVGNRLDLVPTMPKQGRLVEVMKRRRFKQCLDAAESSNNYDYILVDSAPVALTSDTALMAAAIPNVLLVVRPGISDRNSVNETLGKIARHNSRVVGLVINEVDAKAEAYQYQFNGSPVEVMTP